MSPTWLEVALNGPWSRRLQPGIPVRVEEIVEQGVACAEAGAAIVHVHAYDAATGRQKDDPDLYAAIIEGIRDRVDAIVYPTLPLAGGPDAPEGLDARARFAAVRSLAERGLLEWSVVDPGSVNFAHRADVTRDRPGFVYLNPEEHVRAGLELAREHGFHPGYAVYEPGFLRLGAAIAARYPGMPVPVYRFMFSEDFLFGFPPRPYALDALLELLGACAPGASWMVAGLAVDVSGLVASAVERGGHVRVGLEDAPLGTRATNVELTGAAAGAIESAGGSLASAAEVRAALAGRRM